MDSEDLTTPQPPTPAASRPPIPDELLDKNIGSFESSPFTSPRPPVAPPTRPVDTPVQKMAPSSEATPVIAPPTPPSPSVTERPAKLSLQEEIGRAVGGTLDRIQYSSPLQAARVSTPPAPVVNPTITTPAQPSPTPNSLIKPIRTYEGDVAEAMSHRHVSSTSMALAEQAKQSPQNSGPTISNTPVTDHSALKKILLLLVSLLLLGGGAYGAYYLYSQSALAPVTPPPPQQASLPSIVPSDDQRTIVLAQPNPATLHTIVSAELNRPQEPNTIRDIVLMMRTTDTSATRIGGPQALTSLDLNVPNILTRSLALPWMLGIYTDASGNKDVFVVLTTDFFQNTFAGMLQWERVMADDLKYYLYTTPVAGVSNEPASATSIDPLANINNVLPPTGSTTVATSTIVATSTRTQTTIATSTEYAMPSNNTRRGSFEDRIIKNKDVRVFRTQDGSVAFVYSFVDSTHLVITGTESTLSELITRLEKRVFVR